MGASVAHQLAHVDHAVGQHGNGRQEGVAEGKAAHDRPVVVEQIVGADADLGVLGRSRRTGGTGPAGADSRRRARSPRGCPWHRSPRQSPGAPARASWASWSGPTATAAAAPSFSANCSRAGCFSTITTWAAPLWRSAWSSSMPMGPAAEDQRLSPGRSRKRLRAWTTQASGSMKATCWSGMPAGRR